MGPERLEQVEELYHAARECSLAERNALLAQAEPDLRREVEELLAQGGAGGPLAQPAMEIAANLLADSTVSGLALGSQLGRYKIEALVGVGGMGQVYKARDTLLGRYVAIKTSGKQFSLLFEREARAISALNHPHICQLHDVGPNYLVMEFVEGVSLHGPMATAKVVEYARQILDALEHAHEKGIVHRDLKPANIIVTSAGVKLLDFGLAKLNPSTEQGEIATQAAVPSITGGVIGTPAYMAPEQWEGKPADARSDIYAFGCVLYEMLTGKRAWQSGTAPKRTKVAPSVLNAVIHKCLAPNLADRFQSASEIRAALHGTARRPLRIWAAAAAGLVILTAAGLLWRSQAKPPLTDKDVLVLADFNNNSGDSVFDTTLRQALAIQLEQSPFLKIMEDDQVREALQLMGRPARATITNDTAREICIRAGEKATIGGSIALLGKKYAISIQATNCQTSATLAREQVEAKDKDDVLATLNRAVAGIRQKLGESLSSIEKPRVPGWTATTTSLEAFQAFSLADTSQLGAARTIPLMKRAIELDPNFAMAYFRLGNLYSLMGDEELRLQSFSEAFDLRNHVSERERLLISGLYYHRVKKDLNRATDAYRLLTQAYPRELNPHQQLAMAYEDIGEFEKATQELQQAIRIAPRAALTYGRLMRIYRHQDRLEEARVVGENFLKMLDHWIVRLQLLQIAYAKRDLQAAGEEIHWFTGRPNEYESLREQAAQADLLGQRKKAKTFRRQASEIGRRQGLTPNAANFQVQDVANEPLFAKCTSEGFRAKSSLAQALCGDSVAMLQLIESAPNPNDAQTLYLRGLNFLRANRAHEAAQEFQKLLDHRGANWGPYEKGESWRPYYPVAYVQLARAATLAGDKSRAKNAYQDFLSLWKDADPDIPILIAAKKEYAALK
jgi:eukaryotic-like serine/threonine-protein kinase